MLIKKLAELQNQIRKNDREFAKLLSISAPYWCSLRRRRVIASKFVVDAAHRAFPELSAYEVGELPEGDLGIVNYWAGRPSYKISNDRRCHFCGTTNNLHIHHKDLQGRTSVLPNHELDNLLTLCASCHVKLHRIIRMIEGRIRASLGKPEVQVVRVRIPKSHPIPDLNRLIDIAIRDAQGEPMETIGISYGLTRQRVKQILSQAMV